MNPIIGDLLREERAVGKHGHQEAFLLRMGVDIQKILPRQRLAAGEGELQAAGLVDLVHDPDDLVKAEFLSKPVGGIEAIRVTHDAAQVTAAG